DSTLPAATRHLLEVAARNAKRLGRLVDDVLVVAQADAGRLSLHMGEVDLAALAVDCVEAAAPIADERGIALTTEVEEVPAGLGLAIVKMIVDAHGGLVGVQGEEGVGSVFRVELPCAVPPPVSDRHPAHGPARDTGPADRRRNEGQVSVRAHAEGGSSTTAQ